VGTAAVMRFSVPAPQATNRMDDKIAALSECLRDMRRVGNAKDVGLAAWLSMGRTGPPHTQRETGVAARTLLAAADEAFGPAPDDGAAPKGASVPEAVAARWRPSEGGGAAPALTLRDIAAACDAAAAESGPGARERRVSLAASLLRRCASGDEAELACAALLGGTRSAARAGMGAKGVVHAVTHAVTRDPGSGPGAEAAAFPAELRAEAWQSFAFHQDFEALAELAEQGELGASAAGPVFGTPFQPMLGVASGSVEEATRRARSWSAPWHELPPGGRGPEPTVALDWKLDGERVQVHWAAAGGGRVFSRNGEDTTLKYAALLREVGAARELCPPGERPDRLVLEAEAVMIEPVPPEGGGEGPLPMGGPGRQFRLLPFRHVTRLSRLGTQADDGAAGSGDGDGDGDPAPGGPRLAMGLFDLLQAGDENLAGLPLSARRRRLREVTAGGGLWPGSAAFLVPCTDVAAPRSDADPDFASRLRELALEAAAHGAEGLMIKPLDSTPGGMAASYSAGSKSTAWTKLKVDAVGRGGLVGGDTLDLVVVGAFPGKGRRAGGFGAFLVACAAADGSGQFVPVARIGTGLTDETLQRVSKTLEGMCEAGAASQEGAPGWLNVPAKMTPAKRPALWVTSLDDAPVWEVRATELTPSAMYEAAMGAVDGEPGRGVSLRFPRLVRERPDKNAAGASTEDDVASLVNVPSNDGQ